jgi:hypothetical protein
MLAPILLTVAVLTQAVPPTAPALSREDMAKFLTTAKVVGHHDIDRGVTHPVRLTLSDGTITHEAAFTLVDEHKEVMQLDSGRTELNFVDSYKYTLAAYGIAEILAVDDMMPVTVPFQWDQHKGALSWWLDVKMDEGERMKKKLEAPDLNEWGAQVYRMRIFAALVGDTDRNAGNILIGPDWKLWMIDFTRAFRTWKNLEKPETLTRCDKRLLGRMRILTADGITQHTDNLLTVPEINALLSRRDQIIKRFDDLIAQKGASKVLY